MTREFRASGSIYVGFGLIFGGLTVWFLVIAIIHPDPQTWLPVALCAAALAFSFLWLYRFRLAIGPDHVAYRSLFRRSRTIPKSDIVLAGFAAGTNPFTEGVSLFIIRGRDGDELRINAKVFSREAVAALTDLAREAGRAY